MQAAAGKACRARKLRHAAFGLQAQVFRCAYGSTHPVGSYKQVPRSCCPRGSLSGNFGLTACLAVQLHAHASSGAEALSLQHHDLSGPIAAVPAASVRWGFQAWVPASNLALGPVLVIGALAVAAVNGQTSTAASTASSAAAATTAATTSAVASTASSAAADSTAATSSMDSSMNMTSSGTMDSTTTTGSTAGSTAVGSEESSPATESSSTGSATKGSSSATASSSTAASGSAGSSGASQVAMSAMGAATAAVLAASDASLRLRLDSTRIPEYFNHGHAAGMKSTCTMLSLVERVASNPGFARELSLGSGQLQSPRCMLRP
ncbi:hypothetical protein PHYSODRAFT_306107 [Phytophthora sojae]|uniref:Uncharacterized protein n=1 Tax=Phytophthora sojae (strain P6497) TaxID=1094619 RepID=G5A7X3_PHYSP|nr:hypothetical protein PHYSODRAFT_306107 [Phytophthora sojae]EGZ07999.1 hypothetical protein PHYSODRAFT_306107 [Phytophthora sojae]|eukprot:XP_009536171.1 hypothetical protein PHYSODRAFT_306107 [Phytophthora sojae]